MFLDKEKSKCRLWVSGLILMVFFFVEVINWVVNSKFYIFMRLNFGNFLEFFRVFFELIILKKK